MNCIKRILKEQGRTQKWLAIQLNRSQNTVSSWCANQTQPTVDDLFLIGKLINVSPKDLIVDNKPTHK
jgi:putative transcriptional regulator